MPELPEVQAHAERLEISLAGAVLERVESLAFAALKTYQPPPDAAVGRPLETVGRRGKLLVLGFGDQSHVVHLMQGGRLRPDSGAGQRPKSRLKGGLMRWHFRDHPALTLTEAGTERKAGIWVVEGDPLSQPPLDGLGPEADKVEPDRMAALFTAHPQRLHGFLRDQRVIAGLGRRLANEVCHRARLSPFALIGGLTEEAAMRVVDAIRLAVTEGLAFERARGEMSASKDRPAAVHDRAGEACPTCGDTVRAVVYRDYTVNYCPSCQTGGKILADNVYSRLGLDRDAQPARASRRPRRR
ncbi:MAG: DNA-formamidopyrimidine glycosylase family protein [Egibacteraceae bacterium]